VEVEARVAWTLPEGRNVPTLGEALAEQAYELLRDAVISQQIPAGARLSVPELARRLGISRSPVREAIARLVHERLAISEVRRGAVVASVSREDLIEIYDVREVLEGLACRLAAERITDQELAALDQLVVSHRSAVDAGDVAEHMMLDQSFHAAIRAATHNSRLVEGLDRLQGQIRMAMATTRRSPGGMKQALAEHEEVLAALRRRDPGLAEQVGRGHIARLRRELGTVEAAARPA